MKARARAEARRTSCGDLEEHSWTEVPTKQGLEFKVNRYKGSLFSYTLKVLIALPALLNVTHWWRDVCEARNLVYRMSLSSVFGVRGNHNWIRRWRRSKGQVSLYHYILYRYLYNRHNNCRLSIKKNSRRILCTPGNEIADSDSNITMLNY